MHVPLSDSLSCSSPDCPILELGWAADSLESESESPLELDSAWSSELLELSSDSAMDSSMIIFSSKYDAQFLFGMEQWKMLSCSFGSQKAISGRMMEVTGTMTKQVSKSLLSLNDAMKSLDMWLHGKSLSDVLMIACRVSSEGNSMNPRIIEG